MAKGKYEGKDNAGRPKSEYLERLANMTVEELTKETENKIWLSAYASNNPRSDYHWHCDACYDECQKRDPEMYEKAWKRVSEEYGH